MDRYLARACPRCNGYVGIVIREPGRNRRPSTGGVLGARIGMAWIVVKGTALQQECKSEPRLNRN